MIKSTALSELLKRTLKNGIDQIFISNLSGEILAKDGVESTTTITDVISTMWTDYNANGEECFKQEKLNYLIIENDDSFIVSSHLYGYIVTMKASKKTNLGMIKIHLETLVKFLHEKFSEFSHILEERHDLKAEN